MDSTLAERAENLKKAEAQRNPVEVTGYGRESTHKGYLSRILRSRCCNIAGKAALLLKGVWSPSWRGGISFQL